MIKIKSIANNLLNPWIFFSLLVSIIISIPILSLMTNLLFNYSDSWGSIIHLDIWRYIFNSLNIIFFQSIFVILLKSSKISNSLTPTLALRLHVSGFVFCSGILAASTQ